MRVSRWFFCASFPDSIVLACVSLRFLSDLRCLFLAALCSVGATASAQQTRDTSAAYPWRDSVRYGGGPSVGAPPSDYSGAAPPSQWCLQVTGRATGDFGFTGQSWNDASRSWLRQILSDTSDFGAGWRKVLGGAPPLAQTDSIMQVTAETECHAIADIINRQLLGWKTGPPPIVV